MNNAAAMDNRIPAHPSISKQKASRRFDFQEYGIQRLAQIAAGN